MAKGKKKSCKVCESQNRLEIEIWKLVDGLSPRPIEDKLYEEKGEEISHATINTHFRDHVDKKRELTVKYMAHKRAIADGTAIDDSDETGIKLKELNRLDDSIGEAHILVQAASREIRNQLKMKIAKTTTSVKGSKIKLSDENGNLVTYTPLQQVLVQLYKTASEELRQSVKTKMEILGVDSASRAVDTQSTLVDLIMQVEEAGDE
jgi:hypothetical protein